MKGLHDIVEGSGRGLPLGAFIKGLCRFLPMFSIEPADRKRRKIGFVDAADIHRPFARVQPGSSEGMDAAMFAEVMLGGLFIELIEGKVLLAADDAKAGLICSVPQRARAATQRAIAVDYVVELGL